MTFPLLYRKFIRGFQDHIKSGLSGATDYVAYYEPVYAPWGGKCYLFEEPQGGQWVGIRRDNGEKIEFAHLSQRLVANNERVVEGQQIAVSGNTGAVTTGAHLHVQCFDVNGQRIDPDTEVFFAKSLPVIAVNADIAYMKSLQTEILKYSAGMLTITWDTINRPIQVDVGMLDQFTAYGLVDELFDPKYLPYRYLFLFYPATLTSAFLATYYYPTRNNMISSVPQPALPRLVTFEFAHQVQTFYNANRETLPQVEVIDVNYPTDELIAKKLRSILPYIKTLGGGEPR